MPRRREVPKRETLPDPMFGSTLITKFINCMMIQGKKSVAEGAFYGSLEIVKDRAKEDPVKVFKKAMDNVKPILEVKSRRVGGATYQVPIEVPQDRRTSLAIRWIISNAQGARRKDHEGKAGSRDSGCFEQSWRRHQEKRRYAPHGRSQQGFCSLSVVVRLICGTFCTFRTNSKYRHHGTH